MRLKIYLEIDAMKNRVFDFGDFKITKREILASISIIAMMLLIGFVISGRISNYILDRKSTKWLLKSKALSCLNMG